MGQRHIVQTTNDGIPFLRGIVYGFGGSGKTHFGFSFQDDPRTGPVLVLNASGNPDNSMGKHPEVVVIDLEKFEDIDGPWAFLYAGQPENHPFRTTYDIPKDMVFKTLFLDTYSDWQMKMIDHITGQRTTQALSDARGPTLKERGVILSKSVKPARDLLTMLPNMHVILAMQEKTRINVEGGTSSSMPWVDGSARELIPSWANFAANFTQRQVGKDILPVMTWQATSLEAYTKNQWVEAITERGMAAPTATKLFDLAAQALQK